MAKEVVSLSVEVESGQAIAATKNLKAELKDATKQLQLMAAQNKENTQEYVDQRNKVAALQDKMRNFKEELKALDPEKKFQAIGSIASNIAGGFQLAQSAMALFGTESKDVEKALLKVQAATALAQGIDSIRTMGDSFRDMKLAIGTAIPQFLAYIGVVEGATVAQNIYNVALTAFKALISPLGLLITGVTVALGYLAKTMWDESKATEASIAATARYNEIKKDQLKVEQEHWDKIRLLRADNLKGREKEITQLRIQEQNALRDLEQAAVSKHTKEVEAALIRESFKIKQQEVNDKFNAEELAKQKAANDAYVKAQQERVRKENDLYNQLANMKRVEREQVDTNTKLLDFDFDEQKKKREKRDADYKKSVEDSIALAETERQAKLAISQSTLNIATNLGTLLIKDRVKLEKFNRRAALIQIGIDTATALSQLLATTNAPTVDNILSGGAAGIAKYVGFAATVTANAVKARNLLNSGGSSNMPTASAAPSLSTAAANVQAPAPNIQRVAQEVTFVDRDSVNAGQFIRAVVSEGDITDKQLRRMNIEERAKR